MVAELYATVESVIEHAHDQHQQKQHWWQLPNIKAERSQEIQCKENNEEIFPLSGIITYLCKTTDGIRSQCFVWCVYVRLVKNVTFNKIKADVH